MSEPSTQTYAAGDPPMPTYCPSWCSGGHIESYAEGSDLEWARTHLSEDLSGACGEIRNYSGQVVRRGGGYYELQLQQPSVAPGNGQVGPGFPTIRLEVLAGTKDSGSERTAIELTAGEARSMAARLVRLADAEELNR